MATLQKDRSLFGGGGKNQDGQKPKIEVNNDQVIQEEVEKVEKELNELRANYELYFMGVEKAEPVNQRDLLKATIRRWQEMRPRNTALKFKIQQLKARMVSLENYWQRVMRQRESGTYHRDQAKVDRREAERLQKELQNSKQSDPRNATLQPAGAPPNGQAISGAALYAGKSAAETNGKGGVASKPSPQDVMRPRVSSADELTEPKLRKLYDTYVSARKRCGEAVDLRFEDMAAALRKQVPKLLKDTGARSVEFKVVIREQRAVLKAVPRHED